MATHYIDTPVANTSFLRLRLDVTRDDTNRRWRIDWYAQFVNKNWWYTNAIKVTGVVINGTTVWSGGTYSNYTTAGTYDFNSGTTYIAYNDNGSAKNFTASISGWFYNYGDRSKSDTISTGVGAAKAYTVSYNANGGKNPPAAQTKYHGTNLTLRSDKPTKDGHTFQGWATSANGSVVYAAGATYTSNSGVTLYAVWKANTYDVVYNANGGTGAPTKGTKTYGVNFTLTTNAPNRTNYKFLGWSTSPTAGTAQYLAGGTYTLNADITLYAVWELDYTLPTISNLTVGRCDSGGNPSDDGTYISVSFSWSTFKTVSSITIQWKKSNATSFASTDKKTISATGNSGTVNTGAIGNGAIDIESSYTILVTVADSMGSTPLTKPISSKLFVVDYLLEGNGGVKFGGVATLDGFTEFAYKALFEDDVIVNDDELELDWDKVFAGRLIPNSQSMKHGNRTSYAGALTYPDEYFRNNATYWTFTTDEDGIVVANAAATGQTSDLYSYICTPFIPIEDIPNGVEFSFWFMTDNIDEWSVKAPVQIDLVNSAGSRINYQSPTITHARYNNPEVISNKWVKIVMTYPMSVLSTWSSYSDAAYVAFRMIIARNGSIHFKLPSAVAL